MTSERVVIDEFEITRADGAGWCVREMPSATIRWFDSYQGCIRQAARLRRETPAPTVAELCDPAYQPLPKDGER